MAEKNKFEGLEWVPELDERREHAIEEVTDRRQVGYPGADEKPSWQGANDHIVQFTDELRGISDKAADAFQAFDNRHDLGNYSSTERKEIVAAFDKSFKNVEFHGDDDAKHHLAEHISKTVFDPIETHVEKLEFRLSKNDSPTPYTMADHETTQAAMNYFKENFAKALEHPDPDKADSTDRMETLVRYATIHFNEANIMWADHNERTNDAVREVVDAFQQHHEMLQFQMNHPSYRNPFPPGGEERFKELLEDYHNEIETTEELIDKRATDHTQEITPSINALIEKSSRIDQTLRLIAAGV